jgi:hypothetical protein
MSEPFSRLLLKLPPPELSKLTSRIFYAFRLSLCFLSSPIYFSQTNRISLYLSSYFRKTSIYSDSDFFFWIEGLFASLLSKIARFARLANWRVEKVYAEAEMEGLMQIINLILPWPSRESLKMRVSLEFLKGICVLDLSIRAEMQCPRQDRLPFILVSSWIRVSFSALVRSFGILNFYDPARSTIRNLIIQIVPMSKWPRFPLVSPC